LPSIASAETLVAARTIRSQSVLAPTDLALVAGDVAGALSLPEEAIGMEARVVLYAGRPIRPEDIGPAALIVRNQTVIILFRRGSLVITAEGRSLGRGTIGDRILAMNLGSHTTVSGTIGADGLLHADGGEGS
jgi:flagellar basal body P-ring formation protein FlgA